MIDYRIVKRFESYEEKEMILEKLRRNMEKTRNL